VTEVTTPPGPVLNREQAFPEPPAAPAALAALAASAGEKPAGQGARRRRGRHDPWRTAFFVLVVVALVAGVAWALLGSSLFVVRSVQVTGSARVPPAKVLTAAGIKLGTPLVRIDTRAIERRVEKITQVQSARVRRSWPDRVTITTVGRVPMFAVRAGRRFDVLDRFGVVLGHTSRPRAGLIRLRMPAIALRGNPAVLVAGRVVAHLPHWLRQRVSVVRVPSPGRIVLILRRGITVMWGGAGDVRAKAEEVFVLLRTKATYYDVSDPQSAATGWPGR
jgi:cell division protein FtsQ